jgi:hypothetical protein
VTRDFSAIYRDWQKTTHLDTDANSLNRRAVMLKHQQPTNYEKI